MKSFMTLLKIVLYNFDHYIFLLLDYMKIWFIKTPTETNMKMGLVRSLTAHCDGLKGSFAHEVPLQSSIAKTYNPIAVRKRYRV